MSNNTSFSLRILFLACCTTAAQGAPTIPDWWITLEAGEAFLLNGSSTIEPMPNVNRPDAYTVTNIDNTPIVGLGVGSELRFHPDGEWFPTNRVGLYYDYYFSSTLSGDIDKWEYVNAYTYSYKVASNTFWVNDQQDLFRWNGLAAFIEAGIGVSFNSTSDYDEMPVSANPPSDQRDEPAAFESNTNASFAWRVGAGLNYILPWWDNRIRIAVLYRYTDRGDVETGSSANYPSMNEGLSTDLRSNEIMATMSYQGNQHD